MRPRVSCVPRPGARPSRFRPSRWRALGAGAALILLAGLTSCTGGDTGSSPAAGKAAAGSAASGPLKPYYTQSLGWSSCGSGFQCATLRVPLDYAKPGGGDIRIAVIRLPAVNRDQRIGSLLLNPGGPGGSGFEYARNADSVTSRELRQRFDVVGFDPRGVGRSSPVKCLDDRQLDQFIAIDQSPDTPAEKQQLDTTAKFFANQCQTRSGRLLPHVSTADAARDMDVLRAALGDQELYYIGKSYGTLLGATYAELFPRNVGRLVLDGAIDPRTSAADASRAQAAGFGVALKAFIRDCVTQPGCPLGSDATTGLARIDSLLASVDRQPLPGSGGRQLTQALATLGIALAMYDAQFGWPALRKALTMAFAGDGSGLLRLADLYTERNENGRYANNQNEVIYAVNCTDRPDVRSVAEVEAALPSFQQASPQFGAYIAWGSLPCAYWPAKPQDKPHAVTAPGAKPILVVGTTRDPATPYAWSQGLADQLSSGVLLTYDGDGHTAYGDKSTCIDSAVDLYLLEGRPPADGTRCG